MDKRKVSKLQEKDVAKKFNGRTSIASGALWFDKADVRSDKFLIECKYTDNDYYILTKTVWNKICKEAIKDNLRTPLLCIYLRGGKEEMVIAPYNYFPDFILKKADFHRVKMKSINSINIRYGYCGLAFTENSQWEDFVIVSLKDFLDYDKMIDEFYGVGE